TTSRSSRSLVRAGVRRSWPVGGARIGRARRDDLVRGRRLIDRRAPPALARVCEDPERDEHLQVSIGQVKRPGPGQAELWCGDRQAMGLSCRVDELQVAAQFVLEFLLDRRLPIGLAERRPVAQPAEGYARDDELTGWTEGALIALGELD